MNINKHTKIPIAKLARQDDPIFKAVEILPAKTARELRTFSEKLQLLIPTVLGGYIAGIKLLKYEITLPIFLPLIFLSISHLLILIMIYPRKGKNVGPFKQALKNEILKGIKYNRRFAFWAFLSYFLGVLSAAIILILKSG